MNEIKRSWRELPKGAVAYKSSKFYKTGDWGVEVPKINLEKCIKCNFCHFFCPEGCILVREDGFPEPDYSYCKGCKICAKECPVDAIEMVRK